MANLHPKALFCWVLFVALSPLSAMGGIYKNVPEGLDEVDVIIAGGGTTGCVVAARLSDADPSLSILVVERGQDSWNDPAVTSPLFFIQNILNLGKPNPRMRHYQGQQESSAADRAMVVSVGNILGGGSAINMLTYTRAQREDMDGWNTLGWSADDILPYMKKLETYLGPGSPETHGFDGPIKISEGPCGPTQLQDQFVKAAAMAGLPESVDLQNLDSNQAVQRNLRFISKDGVRQDAAHGYLHPRLGDGKHPNLHVLVEHEVLRVIIEDARAVGVEIRTVAGAQNSTQVRRIMSKKMVVMSAGTLGTPLLLERSGVGDEKLLNNAGVDVVANIPGVGENFRDHHTMLLSYYTSLLPNETYDELLKNRTTFDQLLNEKAPILGWNSAEITSKLRPTEEEISLILGKNAAARALWEQDFQSKPNRPIATTSTANGFIAPIPKSDENEQFLSTGNFLLYPYSHGQIHTTGQDTNDEIDLKTGILSEPSGFDLAMAMWLYKKQREVIRRLDVYRGEYAPLHPAFAADSDAACTKRDGPLPAGDIKDIVKDIVYTAGDDAVLEQWVRASLAQNWHGSGTCKMAPLGEGGVVDAGLGVHGVKALKIADLSVVPVNVAANTANLAFAIGEKAADVFARSLNIPA
ncbi:hypothetical protein Daus18300_004245 [Diaporthe australafricana]|uniref:Glucose-methanol-choline oxidoreductase N-terminal domain-containing protein n=1 Tax=Diaporthe australafricana TaxID=127596 RepID=A0ABR3XAP6_9PEZI